MNCVRVSVLAGILSFVLFFSSFVLAEEESLAPDDLIFDALVEESMSDEQLSDLEQLLEESCENNVAVPDSEKCKRHRGIIFIWGHPIPVSYCAGTCAYPGETCQGPTYIVGTQPGGRCTCMTPSPSQ